jgi:hypothetical protein
LSTALFSALGLMPLACGGAFSGKNDDGESGSSAGGSNATGGTKASAGKSSGGTKSTGGSVSTAGKASGGSSGFPCDDPKDLGNGYEQCGNGPIHRTSIDECPSKLPRPTTQIALPTGSQCMADTDCADMPHGYCTTGGQLPGTFCAYGCVKDSECGAGNICVCGDPVGHCVGASCTSDADCGDAFRCQSYDSSHGCGIARFACQTAKDTCQSDQDCAAGSYCDGSTGSFTCTPGGCAIGRPFLVEGQERVATVAARTDWTIAFAPAVAGLSNEARQTAANAWARIGQMEHASVAAFARFALQLLSLGAPAELLELTTQAMADETRHARLAFGIASAFGEKPVGPAKLDVEHSLNETSLADVVRLVVREGCIGETSAALEAREAAERAASPELTRMLAGVADDESRHAELAWRFVSWALERAPREVGQVLESELERAARATQTSLPEASADELAVEHCGLVGERLRRQLQNAAFHEVIAPCARALLGRARRVSSENLVVSA